MIRNTLRCLRSLFVAGVSACGGSNVGNDNGSNNRRDSSSIDIYYGGIAMFQR